MAMANPTATLGGSYQGALERRECRPIIAKFNAGRISSILRGLEPLPNSVWIRMAKWLPRERRCIRPKALTHGRAVSVGSLPNQREELNMGKNPEFGMFLFALTLTAAPIGGLSAQLKPDLKGSQDHPMISRVEGSRISSFDQK